MHGIPRREHEDGDLSSFLAQTRKHLPSVEPRQHHVKHDEVEVDFQGQVQSLEGHRRQPRRSSRLQ
jgi:hypothetical protein